MLELIKIKKYLKYPQILNNAGKKGHCFACGKDSAFDFREIVTKQLANDWRIDLRIKKGFDLRESLYCQFCGNSLRTRQMAKALVLFYSNGKVRSLKDLVNLESFRKLRIAEINACGNLHPTLRPLPLLYYSEFTPPDKEIRKEDLQNLSYQDEFFDLVLTSDTLEHVPDLEKALEEIRRILKPGGYHVFTIPIIMSRKTRERIVIDGDDNKSIKKLLPDSFHGSGESDNIVFREFGADVIDLMSKLQFKAEIYFYNLFRADFSFVFVCQRC